MKRFARSTFSNWIHPSDIVLFGRFASRGTAALRGAQRRGNLRPGGAVEMEHAIRPFAR